MCSYKTTNYIIKMVKSLNETTEWYRAMVSFSTLTASKWLPVDTVWIYCVIASLPGNKVKIVSLVRHLKYLNFLVTTSNVRFGLHWTIIRGPERVVVGFASRARWVSDVGCFLPDWNKKALKSVRMLRVIETCSTTERGKVFAWVERCLRIRRGEGKACEAWAFFLR